MQLQRIHHKSKTTYTCPNKVQYHIIILLHFLNMVTSQHLSKMGATLKLTEFEPTTFACPERRGELFFWSSGTDSVRQTEIRFSQCTSSSEEQ